MCHTALSLCGMGMCHFGFSLKGIHRDLKLRGWKTRYPAIQGRSFHPFTWFSSDKGGTRWTSYTFLGCGTNVWHQLQQRRHLYAARIKGVNIWGKYVFHFTKTYQSWKWLSDFLGEMRQWRKKIKLFFAVRGKGEGRGQTTGKWPQTHCFHVPKVRHASFGLPAHTGDPCKLIFSSLRGCLEVIWLHYFIISSPAINFQTKACTVKGVISIAAEIAMSFCIRWQN